MKFMANLLVKLNTPIINTHHFSIILHFTAMYGICTLKIMFVAFVW